MVLAITAAGLEGADAQTPERADIPDSLPAFTTLELRIGGVRVHQASGQLLVDIALDNLIDRNTAEQLERGVPATVLLDIELWRERGLWFDRLVASTHVVSRIQYDVWDEIYELETADRSGRTRERVDTIEEVAARVTNIAALVVTDLAAIEGDRQYYLMVAAALKPFTLDDVDELEAWLSGVKGEGRPGMGILGLPKQLFGVILSLTGLRDRNDTVRTRTFTRGDALDGLLLEQE
jgi:hypothetical protein